MLNSTGLAWKTDSKQDTRMLKNHTVPEKFRIHLKISLFKLHLLIPLKGRSSLESMIGF
jgi:hypothetical protein